jgi:hypothetical protein
MPAMKKLKPGHCSVNIAGMARSYGVVVLNLMARHTENNLA